MGLETYIFRLTKINNDDYFTVYFYMIRFKADRRVFFRKFDYLIQVLIILSLISFALETIPNLKPQHKKWLYIFEICTVIVFSIEYLLRLLFSRSKLSYVFSFFGIVDLIAILPFYLSIGVDLRSIRAFRLLRLFRLLKLARYNAAMQRYHRAFVIVKEEFVLFSFIAMIILYLASVGIYHFENKAQPDVFSSVFDSLWWAVVTLTTVGYGDAYPITVGGKIFTFVVLMIGIGFIAIPTGLLASALSSAREQIKKRRNENLLI